MLLELGEGRVVGGRWAEAGEDEGDPAADGSRALQGCPMCHLHHTKTKKPTNQTCGRDSAAYRNNARESHFALVKSISRPSFV
jgi:hypothetical protein